MNRTRTAAVLLALPLALTACGGGEPEPAPTVTVTASPRVITETETITVDRMPPECLEAFAAAGRVLEATAPMLDASTELAALAAQAYSAGFTEGATGDTTESDRMVAEGSRLAQQAEEQGAALTAATEEATASLEACKAATQ